MIDHISCPPQQEPCLVFFKTEIKSDIIIEPIYTFCTYIFTTPIYFVFMIIPVLMKLILISKIKIYYIWKILIVFHISRPLQCKPCSVSFTLKLEYLILTHPYTQKPPTISLIDIGSWRWSKIFGAPFAEHICLMV